MDVNTLLQGICDLRRRTAATLTKASTESGKLPPCCRLLASTRHRHTGATLAVLA